LRVVVRRSVLLLVSIAVSLGAAELVLRAVGYGRITPEMNFGVNTRGALERGGFEPDADLFWTLPVRTSPVDQAIGAIHPRRPVSPKGQRLRLIVLGDSCSRISMAEPPYSELLERALGPRWEVFNAAVPGYTTFQGLTWLHTQLLALKPDLVVVYYGWNDHWRSTGLADRDYADRRRGGLRLLSVLHRRPSPPPVRVALADYRTNLDTITQDITATGAQVIVVAAPFRFTPEARQRLEQTGYVLPGEDPAALHGSYLEVVRTLAGRRGLAVLSADGLFAQLGQDDRLIMRDGIHLTDDGHAVMAAALACLITTGAGADGSLPASLLDAARAALPSSVAMPPLLTEASP